MGKFKLSYQQILDHLEVVDSHLHFAYKEFILSPQDGSNTTDIALKMMLHVGLVGYEPIIKREKLEQGTAGHICLNNNADRKVYITLSNDPNVEKESELATLAHEICHKLLYAHNCYFSLMTDYNEALTDLTTIYAGFGKFTLRGCEVSKSRPDYVNGKRCTTTTTNYTGYLDFQQYKTAYDIVCFVNNIYGDPKYRNTGIRPEDGVHIDDIQEILGKPLGIAYNEQRTRILSEDAKSINQVLQIEKFVNLLKNDIINRQRRYIQILDEVIVKDGQIQNPYKALLIMSMQYQAGKLSWGEEEKTSEILESFTYALDKVKSEHEEYKDIADTTLHIECPICGYKKQNALAFHRNILMKCPKCNKIFYWDATDRVNTYIAKSKQQAKEQETIRQLEKEKEQLQYALDKQIQINKRKKTFREKLINLFRD